MASNALPNNSTEFIGLGNRMVAGLTSLGSALGIVQLTPVSLGAALCEFTTAGSRRLIVDCRQSGRGEGRARRWGLGVELYVLAANGNSQAVASQIVTLFPLADA
jgi:hypothetical protein